MRNIESDLSRVRDKTNGRSRYRCVACGVDVPPVLTPSGAKLFLSRCTAHPKEPNVDVQAQK